MPCFTLYARRECLNQWVNEVQYMRGIIWKILLVKLPTFEAKTNKCLTQSRAKGYREKQRGL